jgi:peptide-methionine (S)-S-oxide reductase
MTETSLILAGGCFWCLDSAFMQLKGIRDVLVGYIGGSAAAANYEAVCTGATGHAEAAEVFFDPEVISADLVLDAFFTMHDPRQLNRQGADVGTQYRSAMFYRTADEQQLFEAALERATEVWGDGVVTTLEAADDAVEKGKFFAAEIYHQDFWDKNPNQGYCVAVVGPKVAKVRQKFANLLK